MNHIIMENRFSKEAMTFNLIKVQKLKNSTTIKTNVTYAIGPSVIRIGNCSKCEQEENKGQLWTNYIEL